MESFTPTYTIRGIIPGKAYQDLVLDFVDEKGHPDFTTILVCVSESVASKFPSLTREEVFEA